MYSTPEFRDIDGTILQYGDVVHASIVCGVIVHNDAPNVLECAKLYVIYLGDWDE